MERGSGCMHRVEILLCPLISVARPLSSFIFTETHPFPIWQWNSGSRPSTEAVGFHISLFLSLHLLMGT